MSKSMDSYHPTIKKFYDSSSRKQLLTHPFLLKMRKGLSEDQVSIVLGQWYYPLNYFPTFLASLISVAPKLELQTYASTILWQELGCGNVEQSHDLLFIKTMTNVGYALPKLIKAPSLKSTENLMNAYKAVSKKSYLYGMGLLYATEAADLAMVSAIGTAVRNLDKSNELPWFDIHVKQEPDHTECVDNIINHSLENSKEEIMGHADYMWALWAEFFNGIQEAVMG
jgi:pyrroloquinoline quinone (PQQ) biosynthesis protein C